MRNQRITTLYNLLRERCGLSQPEAAEFHGVRLDTVKSWCIGRNRAPDGVIEELRALYSKIEKAAANLVERAAEDETEIEFTEDGWPRGALRALIGIAYARLH